MMPDPRVLHQVTNLGTLGDASQCELPVFVTDVWIIWHVIVDEANVLGKFCLH